MTLEQALEILNKYDGTEMTDEQYYNYHCAQNKITRLILSGEYELVKKGTEGDARPSESAIANGVPDNRSNEKVKHEKSTSLKLKGYWRPAIDIFTDRDIVVCSICGEAFPCEKDECPNCHADMRGEEGGLI